MTDTVYAFKICHLQIRHNFMDQNSLTSPLQSSLGPCGSDLIYSSEFDQIQEARRFDDPSLAQGEWVTDVKEADWQSVVRICEDVLSNKSKDLRVACWLIEARSKIAGLAGLADGYMLLGSLCEQFWSDIHPQPEDGDIEQRVGVLDWLANQTPRLLREIALTRSAKGIYSLIDYDSARATAKQIERNPGQADEIARHAHLSLDVFEAAVRDTPKSSLSDGLRDTQRARDAVKQVQLLLDALMGELSPSFGQTFEALDELGHFFQRHGGVPEMPAGTDDSRPTPANAVASPLERREPTIGGTIERSAGPLATREEAIRQLQEIAAFFRRTEPHSPVAYLAEKAAKWGTMPLHEWLRTVVKDDSALLRMEELLGVEAERNETH